MKYHLCLCCALPPLNTLPSCPDLHLPHSICILHHSPPPLPPSLCRSSCKVHGQVSMTTTRLIRMQSSGPTLSFPIWSLSTVSVVMVFNSPQQQGRLCLNSFWMVGFTPLILGTSHLTDFWCRGHCWKEMLCDLCCVCVVLLAISVLGGWGGNFLK